MSTLFRRSSGQLTRINTTNISRHYVRQHLQTMPESSNCFKSSSHVVRDNFLLNCFRGFGSSSVGKKVSAISLTSKKRKGTKVTMVTAYDYPSAIHVGRAGIDIVLVGDSVAMVELGFETTQPVSIDHMIHHASAVKRGVEFACGTNSTKYPLLIGDMPFGSYEYNDTDVALRNAYRFVKEGGMDAVKLEVSIYFEL
jgi:Ketopantoate hydroxymethyltransferase